MQEVFQRGPIACYIAANQALDDYTGGIFEDKTGFMDIDHVVSIVGWGVEHGKKFWIVRNSWGTSWGEEGFFRIVRGVNNLNLESECAWATPTPEIYTTYNITNSTNSTTEQKVEPVAEIEKLQYPYEDQVIEQDTGNFLEEPKVKKAPCRLTNNWEDKGFVPPKVYSW